MGKKTIVIDYRICMACNACIQVCPFNCLEPGRTDLDVYHKEYPQLSIEHPCTGCGMCVSACPVDCISLQS